MKAISMPGPGSVTLIDIPEPDVGPNDVLIEVQRVGLCGSDLKAYRGTSPMVSYPRIPGHEIAGTVLESGEGVSPGFKAGARVTVSPYFPCGECSACRAGRPNCCRAMQVLGVQRHGAMTERIAVPAEKVYASDLLSLEELALVEPFSVGYHAAVRGRVSASDTVLVLGCGAIGLGVIAAAAQMGARVVALDIADEKLALARRLGADVGVNSAAEDAAAAIAALTDGHGVDVAIEAVGLPATYRAAIDLVAYAGRVVFVGWVSEDVPFETKQFVAKELDILGSRNALGEFADVIRMLENRDRPYTEMISRIAPFEHAPQAFEEWNAAPERVTKILLSLTAS
jgi:2-desacetyl-2-hydroxyethyl bacteriochlorophyllide A dehydrogenase